MSHTDFIPSPDLHYILSTNKTGGLRGGFAVYINMKLMDSGELPFIQSIAKGRTGLGGLQWPGRRCWRHAPRSKSPVCATFKDDDEEDVQDEINEEDDNYPPSPTSNTIVT